MKRARGRDGPKKRQQTLESVLGTPKSTDREQSSQASLAPQTIARKQQHQQHEPRQQRLGRPVRFMPRSGATSGAITRSSVSSDSEDHENDNTRVVGANPLRPRPPRRGTKRNESRSEASVASVASATNSSAPNSSQPQLPAIIAIDDSSDEPLATPVPSSSRPGRRTRQVLSDDDDDEDDPQPSTAKRRRLVRKSSAVDGKSSGTEALSSPGKRAAARSARPRPRSDKEKQRELLRRRRLGENIEQLSSSSEDEEQGGALYDTDSDHLVLKEFEDEDDGDEDSALEEAPDDVDRRASPKKPRKRAVVKARDRASGDESDSSLASFIAEDDDGPIGAPADLGLLDVPLEFTAQAHKPLKAHFRDAVDWLVQNRINPSFDRDDPVYRLAWRKLDDEFRGLALSKFSSSAWDPTFYRTLKARPYINTYPAERNSLGLLESDKCQACNRSKHPVTKRIRFSGKPYDQNTMEDVESDSEDSDGGPRDVKDNPIESEAKDWFVGVVCAGNAQTAHDLYHWKHSLKDWVDERLQDEGWLGGEKLEERERLSTKKRGKLAFGIVDEWAEKGVVPALFGDFNRVLTLARDKSTTGARSYR